MTEGNWEPLLSDNRGQILREWALRLKHEMSDLCSIRTLSELEHTVAAAFQGNYMVLTPAGLPGLENIIMAASLRSRAAELLGISLPTLRSKIARYGLMPGIRWFQKNRFPCHPR